MPTETQTEIQQRMEFRSKAVAANKADLPQLEIPLAKLDGVLGQAKDLRAQQASLTAEKQEVSKRLAARLNEGLKLLTFIDAGIRDHYGNRAEKLVEFGLQPFRSQPRIRLIGLDGKPLKRGGTTTPASPAPAVTPPAPTTE